MPFLRTQRQLTCVDTVNDHLKSKKHAAKKKAWKAKNSSSDAHSTSRQMALTMVVKSRDFRSEFVLDYAKMCMIAERSFRNTSTS